MRNWPELSVHWRTGRRPSAPGVRDSMNRRLMLAAVGDAGTSVVGSLMVRGVMGANGSSASGSVTCGVFGGAAGGTNGSSGTGGNEGFTIGSGGAVVSGAAGALGGTAGGGDGTAMSPTRSLRVRLLVGEGSSAV